MSQSIRKRIALFIYWYCAFFTSIVISMVVVGQNNPIHFRFFHFLIPAVCSIVATLCMNPDTMFNLGNKEAKNLS